MVAQDVRTLSVPVLATASKFLPLFSLQLYLKSRHRKAELICCCSFVTTGLKANLPSLCGDCFQSNGKMKMSSLISMIIFLPEKQISKRLNMSIPFLSLFHEMISIF